MAREISTLRRDARQTRRALLDAVGDLLRTQGTYFSLPELAASSGVSTSSTYRHFDSVEDACEQFLAEIIKELLDLLGAVASSQPATDLIRTMCRAWVEQVDVWGPAAVELRATQGLLAGRRTGQPGVVALFSVLESALVRAFGSQVEDPVDREEAALLWLTLFDERLVLDLRESGRTVEETSEFLHAALVGALQHVGDSPGTD